MSIRAPGAAVPVTVTLLWPVRSDRSAGAVTVSGVLFWVCRTYRSAVISGFSSERPAPRSAVSRTLDAAPHVSGDADPSGLPLTRPIDAVVGSEPYGDAGTFGASQTCSGTSPTPEVIEFIAPSRAPASPGRPLLSSCCARSAVSTGQMWPAPLPDGAQGAPSVVQDRSGARWQSP